MRTADLAPGARDLRAYLAATKQSVTGFCKTHKLDRIQVARAMKGQLSRHSVDFAYSIELATGGRVKCFRWRTPRTARSRNKAA